MKTPIRWIKEKFAETIKYINVRIGTSSLLWPVPNEFAEGKAGRKDVNLATALRLISNSIAGLPILVQEDDGDDGWETVPDHQLNALIKTPDPFHDKCDMVKHILQSLILQGNAYFFIETNPVTKQVTQLWPVPLLMMKQVYDKETGHPIGYLYNPNGAKKIGYKPEQILHIKLYDAITPYIGTSPIIPILEQMLSNMFAVRFNKNFFRNGANPGMLFEADENAGKILEDHKKLLSQWNAQHQSADNAFRPGVLPPGYKANVITPSIKDMMFESLIRLNREQIYALLGIPPSVGGVYEFANYANAKIQDQTYWENTLKPFMALIESAFDRQIIGRFYADDDIRIKFDLTAVLALLTDSLKKAQTEEIYVRSGILTINEVRSKQGLPDVSWGDEPPKIGFGTPATPPATNNALLSVNERFQIALDRVEKDIDKLAPGYEKVMKKYFKGQEKRLLDNLSTATGEGLIMSHLAFVVKRMQDDIPDDIFDLDEENRILKEAVKPYDTKATGFAGQSAIDDANIDARFDLKNPFVVEEINNIVNKSTLINEATFNDIKKLLAEAVEDGRGSVALARDIRALYKDYSVSRAKLIARTEMGTVVNGGSFLAYEQENVSREWMTFFDKNTRLAHQQADTQIVKPGQSFSVGGELLRYPLDPRASAKNRINCRCAVAPVIET